ncbi:38706_t:CDS:1 [Gigaspora margarita]|uniref:38706_t:CDS:1 n=1 Tax=Gigaspora margarita TaxID=4874 RepID=A0ABN7VD07_GIGMA|nr:38706_t:CDS:1 [Gigaspora margarita]
MNPLVPENLSPSISSLQKEHDDLLTSANELSTRLPYKLTLSIEEILAPRKQKKNTQNNPRPQNGFILFRKEFSAHVKEQNSIRIRSINAHEISKEASQYWDTLPPQVKQFFTILAKIADIRHKLTYPDYVYKPQKKGVERLEFDDIIDFSQCS